MSDDLRQQLADVLNDFRDGLLDDVDQGVDRILELAAPEWRSIDTAPANTPVLIYEPGTAPQLGLQMVVAKRDIDWNPHAFTGTYGDGDAQWQPTHWMPLPATP